MAVVLAEFADSVSCNGVAYRAQACGAPGGTVWEGWIEFNIVRAYELSDEPIGGLNAT